MCLHDLLSHLMEKGDVHEQIQVSDQDQFIDLPLLHGEKIVRHLVQVFLRKGHGLIALTDKALCQDHVQVILIDRRVLRVFLLLFPHEPLKAGSVPLIFEGNQLAHEPDRLCFVISAHGVHELVHFHVHVFQHPQEPRERNIGLSALEPRDLRLGNMLIRNLLQGDVPVGPEIMEYSAQLINVLHILSQSPRLQGVKGPLGPLG